MPPIVGVPTFSKWVRPSSRIRRPPPDRNRRIATGVPSSVTARPTAPATRIGITGSPPRPARPATRPLAQDEVAGRAAAVTSASASPGSSTVATSSAHALAERGARDRACRAPHGHQTIDPDPRRAPPGSCSSAEIGPSSAISPSTAINRASPAIQRAVRSAAAVDSGSRCRRRSRPARRGRRERLHPPAGDGGVAQRALRVLQRRRAAHRRGGERVRHHVFTGHRERTSTSRPSATKEGGAAVRPERHADPRGRPRRLAFRTSRPARARLGEPRRDRVVRVQDRDAPGVERVDGSADARRSTPTTRRSPCAPRRRSDHHDVGSRDPREELHVPDAARPHLRHEHLGVVRRAEHGGAAARPRC